MRGALIGGMLAAAVAAAPGFAANRCVDAAGKVTYTDEPCSSVGAKQSRAVKEDGISVVPTQPGAEPRSAPRAPGGIPRAGGDAPAAKVFRKSPGSPVFTFCYDPADGRSDVSNADIENAIQAAARAWNAGCNVNLRYLGACSKDIGRHDAPVDYRIYWAQWDATMRINGANDRSFQDHFLAAASPRIGIGLNRTIASFPKYYRRTIVHEFGHVVGIGHSANRGDVMMPGGPAQVPSPADLDACNNAVETRHGVK